MLTEQVQNAHGLFLWNQKTVDEPGGEAGAWHQVTELAGARWVLLREECHTPHDAEVAGQHGLMRVLRTRHYGFVNWEDVLATIGQYAGKIEVLQLGGEPVAPPDYPGGKELWYWQHAQYLEWVAEHCSAAAEQAGIALCTPGWQGGDDFPAAPAWSPALVERLREVYKRFPYNAVHCYDVFNLATRPQMLHVATWVEGLAMKQRGARLIVSEYGIAARLLAVAGNKAAGDLEKARRYVSFLAMTQSWFPHVFEAALMFICGGVNWEAFGPNGENSYNLGDDALASLGDRVGRRVAEAVV